MPAPASVLAICQRKVGFSSISSMAGTVPAGTAKYSQPCALWFGLIGANNASPWHSGTMAPLSVSGE